MMSWSSAVHTPTNITNITSTPKLGREATTHMNFAELIDDPCVAPFTLERMRGRNEKRKKNKER
jgi:hypothetical protein